MELHPTFVGVMNGTFLSRTGFDSWPPSFKASAVARHVVFGTIQNMARKSTKVKPQKRGRPAAGKDQLVGVRLPDAMIKQIDTWAKREGVMSRSEAIRHLVDQSLLAATQQPRRGSHKGASKASELAGQEVDRVANQSVPVEEQERRKRQLTRGPKEFRGMRDLSKAKG